jgi:hypothetical protein
MQSNDKFPPCHRDGARRNLGTSSSNPPPAGVIKCGQALYVIILYVITYLRTLGSDAAPKSTGLCYDQLSKKRSGVLARETLDYRII